MSDSKGFPVVWIESGDRLREVLAEMPNSNEIVFFCRVDAKRRDESFFAETLAAFTDLPLRWWNQQAVVEPGSIYLVCEDQPWGYPAEADSVAANPLSALKRASGSVDDSGAVDDSESASNVEPGRLLDPQTRRLLAGAGVDALVLDRDLLVQAFTAGAGDAFCLLPHDIGRPIDSFRHQFRDVDLYQHIKDSLRYDKRIRFEIQMQDGPWHWMCLRPSRDSVWDGGLILTFTEISSAKETGIEMEQSVRRRDEFLAMLSHELRNPLSAVVSATHILDSPTVPESQRDKATKVIQRQVELMSALMDDLLDVARVTQGKIHVRRRTLDLKRCAELAIETVRSSFQQHQQPLQIDLPEDSIWVDGSFPRLQQVFINLLKNASKYSGDGMTVSLSATKSDNEVCIRIRDQGIGISEAQRSKVFDMFMQNDRAIDRSDGGMGVGLTLVKSIVDLHDGTIRVESEGLGKGSEFIVTLPLSINASNPQIELSGRENAGSSSEVLKDQQKETDVNARVVLVEDNDDARMMLASLMRADGLTVEVCQDGQAGYNLIESSVPDVAVIDIGLPVLNGHQVIAKVKANADLASVHCIALTGYGQSTDRARALAAGFDEHLVKPVNPQRLTRIVRDHLNLKRAKS